ncbi:hypothetical protein P168DRAFT_337427 [Aspergillus campestris IBT 28561]|uniref:Uncharacterized protein n=1 Tax=Aspergillus campestris (strain IBT 28561) TaxID=1392248 RepID=A0A2I1CR84_ASPC2|nr:uncharacterized protein P168DRAFT_337427 [Aspergillus campestris IBT 28561]PKY00128.1 hypothetical protein P168DRAFT_337427 [Aspergillus campestris IBT 28561]
MSHSSTRCLHPSICSSVSAHAKAAGYKQPTLEERIAATNHELYEVNFPAPLVLPEDDLALDPDYPPQSFQEWVDEEDRNKITRAKRTVYIVAPPQIDDSVGPWRKWTRPQKSCSAASLTPPNPEEIKDYIAAFYHGLPVKLLPNHRLRFVPWEADQKPGKKTPSHVGLETPKECIGIRTRPCPDRTYSHQLNLDDLLDAAISILPKDAYALCMLVDHDLFEDDDDEFVCGRAYGGSRVAVVSSARYRPDLDILHSAEREHAWPASHCQRYVQECCSSQKPARKKAAQIKQPPSRDDRLLKDIVDISSLSPASPEEKAPLGLWLARMCRTVSHELGHCFGIDHCVYYACAMQGSASLAEDARQPAYLCPVDLVKVLCATGSTFQDRERAIEEYCKRPGKRGVPFFDALAAWCKGFSHETE